jgi:tRNA nucleotidyltransferase/poly(A) polymerase
MFSQIFNLCLFSQHLCACRLVGGVVRDLLLGQPAHDIDFATNATPDVIVQMLTDDRIHVVETGLTLVTMTFESLYVDA